MSGNIIVSIIIICGVAGYAAMSFLIDALRTAPRRSVPGSRSSDEYYAPRSQTGYQDDETSQARALLGLGADADSSELRARFHEQLAKYHPDKTQHLGVEFQQLAEQKTQEIIRAYDVLKVRTREGS